MSAERWLADRKPSPPAGLSAAIERAVSDSASSQGSESHFDDESAVRTQLIAAARGILPRVIADGCEHRSGALDLLTLDALITYAMEASSSSAAECEATATELLDAIGNAAGAAK